MDSRCLLLAAFVLSLGSASGCGSGGSSTATTGGAAASAPTKPAEVVQEFLEAIRTGNDDKATQMLTEVARRETAKHELVVAPPGSDTARFTVGEVEFVMKDEVAHVASKWTDVGEDGQPHTDDIIWALRRDGAAWRIAGMAANIFPGEPPLLLDFENPEDMIQKQRMAEEEMQRRARAAEAPAANTARPVDGNVLRQ